MLGQDVVNRARFLLNDADATRWTDGEFVNWINDGCRFIALIRPDSCVVNAEMTCVAGTKQSIAGLTPSGLRLLDVVRNSPNGRAVRLVDREVMDTQNPTWHSAAGSATVTNYVFDNRDPKNFYVYPPATVAAKLEIIYSRNPVEITTGTLGSTALSVDDIYMDVLLNYVMYRAYSKDASFAQNAQLASAYRGLVDSLLGQKTSMDAKFSPDLNSPNSIVAKATQAGAI